MRVTEPSGLAEGCWQSVILMVIRWATEYKRAKLARLSLRGNNREHR